MRLHSLFAVLSVIALADAAASFEVRRVATGLARPVFLTAPPGDTERGAQLARVGLDAPAHQGLADKQAMGHGLLEKSRFHAFRRMLDPA